MQQIEYSEQLHAVKTSIKTPFWSASFILGWPWKAAGLGFNKQIINTVKTHMADLVVHVEFNGYDYLIRYEKIMEFLENYKTDYLVKGRVFLTVLPWDWFSVMEEGEV